MARSWTTDIVTVDATVTQAPNPSNLQQSGAIVSVGGTTLSTNAYQYCTTLAEVQAILGSSGNHAELLNMATTFFAQGSLIGLYVLEIGLGGGTAPGQITALTTWITDNPGIFYAYLCPASWDASGSDLQTLAANYSSATGKTYFFVTTSQSTISAYTAKSVVAFCPSPTASGTEFGAAALFYQWISNLPSIAAPTPPMAFRFVFGVTPWTISGNTTTLDEIIDAYGNVVIPAAEGGIAEDMIEYGTCMDGNQMMFWYAVDWLQINSKLNLANAVINGSQPGQQNPLYYNQFGINTLLSVLKKLGTAGISFGLLLSATFTATSFAAYTTANPGDYANGIYKGFACTTTPQLGFTQITFFVDATTFAS